VAAWDHYRAFCVAFLPSLEKLDTCTISAEERARLCTEGERKRLRAALGGARGGGVAPAGGAPAAAAAAAAPPPPPPLRCAHQQPLLEAATLLVGQLDETALEALAQRVARALGEARGGRRG
jgi:hypothetical protein